MNVNSIIGFKDHLKIEFLDENLVTVDYHKDLIEIEVKLASLNSNLRLPNYAIKGIVDYFEEHMYKVETGIRELS